MVSIFNETLSSTSTNVEVAFVFDSQAENKNQTDNNMLGFFKEKDFFNIFMSFYYLRESK